MDHVNDRRWMLGGLLRGVGVASAALLAPLKGLAASDDRSWHGWQLLGEVRAARKADRDVIRVKGQHASRAIRLRVFDAPVEFLSVRVWFRNGESHEVEVRQVIGKGGGTRVIDLPRRHRFLDRVVFWYRTPAAARQQARVQLWARR